MGLGMTKRVEPGGAGLGRGIWQEQVSGEICWGKERFEEQEESGGTGLAALW